MLCDECEEKLRSKAYGKEELQLSKMFLDLRDKMKSLSDLTLVGAVSRSNMLVIQVGKHDVEKMGEEIREITKLLKSYKDVKVTFVETDVPEKEFLGQLVWPNRVLSVKTVWLPDGSKQMRVVLDGKRSLDELKTLEEIARELRGMDIRFELVAR